MAPFDSTARKLAADQTPLYRAAPHNIEAEQALLGAILVNNEALYRVSDFLEAQHFFEPIHQKIFELSSQLVRAGKVASPGHAENLPAGRRRYRRPDRQPVSRAARGRSHHRYQRAGLRPHHL